MTACYIIIDVIFAFNSLYFKLVLQFYCDPNYCLTKTYVQVETLQKYFIFELSDCFFMVKLFHNYYLVLRVGATSGEH